jgi:FlaA1/EpsC-like NDP-sugar epimerase
VPLFREQIARGGPVTLTDAAMTRYFMSIHEAAELIVQAGALSQSGDLFLLEMGEPIPIRTLVENMIRLAGRTVCDEQNPDGDIAISIVGKRPGEKLHEELFYDRSLAEPTIHRKILRAELRGASDGNVEEALLRLRAALAAEDEVAAVEMLFGFVGGTAEQRTTPGSAGDAPETPDIAVEAALPHPPML